MSSTFRYIAVMEAEEGRRGSSRAVLAISDPDVVAAVLAVIREHIVGPEGGALDRVKQERADA